MTKLELQQTYSTVGNKLLAHTDVLSSIQQQRKFIPITVQLALTEACESDCPFCSVQQRPVKMRMAFSQVEQVLEDFRALGAKALELTGGGNPLLYKEIVEVIGLASHMGYQVGIITNSHDLRALKPECHADIAWIRVSLIQLDEGWSPADYNLAGFTEEKVGWSYIVYDTTPSDTLEKIATLMERFPRSKFVRIAGDCLKKNANQAVAQQHPDLPEKWFVKDTSDDPYDDFCAMGMVRPYIAPHPTEDWYMVYICTSHVLNHRTYDLAYALCSIKDIIPAWTTRNQRFQVSGIPYEVNGNGGKNWQKTCARCFYGSNNQLLHAVAHPGPDSAFA